MSMYFNVHYKSPTGALGTHVAVPADSAEEAAALSPVMLTVSSQYQPSDITVIGVYPTPREECPIKE